MDIAQSLPLIDERLRKAGGSGDGTDSISHTETDRKFSLDHILVPAARAGLSTAGQIHYWL